MYKYLLFDLDGTITDSGEGIINSAIYALGKVGITIKDKRELFPFIGPPLYVSFKEIYHVKEELIPYAIECYREDYDSKGLYENKLYDGIVEVLETLYKSGYQIVLATSKPEHLALKILDYFQLSKYFTFVCGAVKNVRTSKTDVIAHALNSLNIKDKKTVVMIGDRKYDVIGAHDNNIDCIAAIYGGYSSEDEFVEEKPEYRANYPLQILEILKK